MAATPPSSATEGRPLRTRCWDRLVILVTAPLRPKQASTSGSSGLATHGPAPPDPDSATYRAPSGPKPIPRGLSSPSATTLSPPEPPEPLAASAMACDGLLDPLGAAVAAPPRAVTAAIASRPATAPARRADLSMKRSPQIDDIRPNPTLGGGGAIAAFSVVTGP